MEKIKKFSIEIYFYKEEFENEPYSNVPQLDKYNPKSSMDSIVANDLIIAKIELLEKYTNVAYIQVHYISDFSI